MPISKFAATESELNYHSRETCKLCKIEKSSLVAEDS